MVHDLPAACAALGVYLDVHVRRHLVRGWEHKDVRLWSECRRQWGI
ncbi:hypothetical protein [Actinacidiphila oryziradicis]|nr:hypothetical protein [Actinacidiphila oryziradicis]